MNDISLYQTNTIDFINNDPITQRITLSIVDSLSWEDVDENEHIFLLQEKLNSYLRFIESGELYEQFPESKDKNSSICIHIIARYPVTKTAQSFLDQAKSIIVDAGFQMKFELQE